MGLYKTYFRNFKKKKIKTEICITNMHLLDSYGYTIDEIKKDGFKVNEKIYMALDGYNTYTMTKSLGVFFISFTDMLLRIKPQWVVIAGDRSESFAACIVAAYNNIPVAHIQAGELSGNIDGQSRHAIGKFAHLHFSANKKFSQILKNLGEQEFRIKTVGSPQLDDLHFISKKNQTEIFNKLNIKKSEKYILVVYHGVTEEYNNIEKYYKIVLDSLDTFNMTKIWILPNNDAGSSIIKNNIIKNRKNNTLIFDNLDRNKYLHILQNASCIVGNSSSGLIEAPTFKIPCVNIGRRQNKRLKAFNVIDVMDYNKKKLILSIKKALSSEFRAGLRNLKNPYGDGDSSEKIVKYLLNTKIDEKLLFKELTY